jgi:Phosphotransferase enzyme family
VSGPASFGLPGPEVTERIEALLGDRVVEFVPTVGGYTPAARWRVRTRGGDRAFVKLARNGYTARALRGEHAVLAGLDADFAPQLIGFEDDAVQPLLAIEDLGDARWPPPWDDALALQVREALARMHARRTALPPFAEVHPDEMRGWQTVAEDPGPFLALGLVSRAWLDAALPVLLDADERAVRAGDSLVHFDVRSDNLCLARRGVVLVDWNFACRGNPELDLGFWLPSLEMEGGPPPERFLPDHPSVAAWVSGFFAARAGLPWIPEAPDVRDIQLRQLRTALPWATRALGLAPP